MDVPEDLRGFQGVVGVFKGVSERSMAVAKVSGAFQECFRGVQGDLMKIQGVTDALQGISGALKGISSSIAEEVLGSFKGVANWFNHF